MKEQVLHRSAEFLFSLKRLFVVYFVVALALHIVLAPPSLAQPSVKMIYAKEAGIGYRADVASGDSYAAKMCVLDIYYPENVDRFSTIVWLHGGGLYSGKRSIPQRLRNQGVAVVAVDYRLHPEVESPVYIQDAAAAVAWVFEHIADYGGDPESIYIAGHSAGGYLASMVGLDPRWLAEHGVDSNQIAGLFPYSGHTFTHFTIRKERGIPEYVAVIDEMAPVHHISADDPPLILITGDRNLERLGRYEENAFLLTMIKGVGHEHAELYEIQGHGHIEMVEPAHRITLKYIRADQKRRAQP